MAEIHEKMALIMGEVGHVGKTQVNKTQGFKYRGIDDIYNALNQTMSKHGVFSTTEVLEKDRIERQTKSGSVLMFTTLKIKFTFYAKDGSSVESIILGEGMDSGDKSSNKAMAVAHKYALLQVFCIPTDEVKDPDHESHEVKPLVDNNDISSFVDAAIHAVETGDIQSFKNEFDRHGKDEQVFLWKQLDSKQRSALKRMQQDKAA